MNAGERAEAADNRADTLGQWWVDEQRELPDRLRIRLEEIAESVIRGSMNTAEAAHALFLWRVDVIDNAEEDYIERYGP